MKIDIDQPTRTNNFYRTRDLSEASYIYASGRKLSQLENSNGIAWFIFEDEGRCKKLADAFWSGKSTINAREYSNAMRNLKNLIFSRI